MLVLSLFAMFAANVVAVFQNNLKRLFAYSSVGQIGYITLGLSFDSLHGLTASITHIFNHGTRCALIFLLIGVVAAMTTRPGVTPALTLDRLAGSGGRCRLPVLASSSAVSSLIGVPGTAGFISKWYLVLAAMEKGQWWLVGAILASSLLAVAYVWRFVEVAYFREPLAHHKARRSAIAPAAAGRVADRWVTLWLGFDTSFTVGSALDAAEQLLRTSR